MQDTYYYLDSSNRIRHVNGGLHDNEFYLDGMYVHGPKNSNYYKLQGNKFISDAAGETGFELMPDRKIFGPSQHLPWFD